MTSAGLEKKKQRDTGVVALEHGWHLPSIALPSFSLAAVHMSRTNVPEAEESILTLTGSNRWHQAYDFPRKKATERNKDACKTPLRIIFGVILANPSSSCLGQDCIISTTVFLLQVLNRKSLFMSDI